MKRIRLSVISVLTIIFIISSMCVVSFADTATTTSAPTEKTSENGVILETVNLVYANKNMRGSGYFWDNINDTLTITNMTIDTTDSYGLRIPADATLVLEGKNTIRASKCALSLEGNLTVKGTGSLTLYSDGYGINASATDMNKKLTFKEGSVTINSEGDGIYSENAIISQNNKAKLEINVGAADAYAINARQVKLLGGTFKSDASIYSRDIKVSNIALDIESSMPAFIINGAAEGAPYEKVKLTDVSIKAGDASASLSKADAYNGEKCVSTKAHKEYTKTSMFLEIFGVSIKGTGYLDFVLIGVAILLVAAFIATPYIKNKKSLSEVEAAKAAAREEEKQNRKQRASENEDSN